MKLYIAGLPDDLDNAELKELFEEFGKVDAAFVVYDKETKQSRGFGFVDMPNLNESHKAISELHGSGLDDNTLTVKIAKDKPVQAVNPFKQKRVY